MSPPIKLNSNIGKSQRPDLMRDIIYSNKNLINRIRSRMLEEKMGKEIDENDTEIAKNSLRIEHIRDFDDMSETAIKNTSRTALLMSDSTIDPN